ncbi:putative DHNTP pyrophosphohydrolase [Lactococcus lactis]|nr:putative DHNTP pyrophosphohydrolase [Lactococcus lactis]
MQKKMGKLVDVNLIDIPFNEIKNEKEHQHIDFRFLLELEEQEAELAELPFFLLELEEAPEEFKKYYRYKKIK